MSQVFSILEILLYLSLVVAIIEMAYLYFVKKIPIGESFANFRIYAVGRLVRDPVKLALTALILLPLSNLVPYKIPQTLSGYLLAILASDFIFYWEHRAGHEMRLLWTFHSVHHSSESFDFSTSFRLSWLAVLTGWIFSVPLVLVGFSVKQIAFGSAIVLLYQVWIHTKTIGRLGLFDKIFNSPSNHRAHHGKNKIYHDKNYGGILIVWDHLFGSYVSESEDVQYGITDAVNSKSAFKINFTAPLLLLRDMWHAPTWRETFLLPY